MTTHTSYTEARAHLAELMDRAGHDLETVIITRRGAPDVALVSADEWRSLQETVHLFSSLANARRLLDAMERAERGEGQVMTMEELRQWVREREEEVQSATREAGAAKADALAGQ